jgi:hypothetical protein
VSAIRRLDADAANLGEAVKAKAFAGHGDQRTSSTNSDVAAELDGPSAKRSGFGHASEREQIGNIGGAERYDRTSPQAVWLWF